jgi:hypothetical protein
LSSVDGGRGWVGRGRSNEAFDQIVRLSLRSTEKMSFNGLRIEPTASPALTVRSRVTVLVHLVWRGGPWVRVCNRYSESPHQGKYGIPKKQIWHFFKIYY